MIKTRTLLAAVVAAFGLAGSADAQSVNINSVGYIAASGPYPATTQPSGTFVPQAGTPYPDPHRVVCDYGTLNAAGTVFTPYTNPADGVVGEMASQIYTMPGTPTNWAMPGKATWPTGKPDLVVKCRARLQRRVAYNNLPSDWSDVATEYKYVR